jgi:hypothetical protein
MPENQFDRKFALLIKEWDQCEASISRFDTIAFGIRGWAVSVFTAILAASITLGHPSLILFAIPPTLLFWMVDSVNKAFQERFIRRVKKIQTYLLSSEFNADVEASTLNFKTPTMALDFERAGDIPFLRKIILILREGIRANVLIVYASILILCFVCWPFLRLYTNSAPHVKGHVLTKGSSTH